MGAQNVLRVHLIYDTTQAILIDTGMRGYEYLVEEALSFLRARQISLTWIVNTHAHHDHVGLNGWVLSRTQAQIVSHPWGRRWIADPEINYREFVLGYPALIPDSRALRKEIYETMGGGTHLNVGVVGGEHFYLGERTDVEIIDTSGHVAGEIGLLVTGDHTLIVGDALVGLTLPIFHGYVDPRRYRQTLRKIRRLVTRGRVHRVLTSHLRPLDNPADILQAIAQRLSEVDEIQHLVLQRIHDQPATLREVWLFVSQAKNKEPEFRGLTMVGSHIAHLQEQGRITVENDRYRLSVGTGATP